MKLALARRHNGKMTALGPEGSKFQSRFQQTPPYMGPVARLTITSYHTPSRWCSTKFGEKRRVSAEASSSSSDCSSKLQGASLNSPRVALKRDVRKTKLNSKQRGIRFKKDIEM
ncbi:hypothetical protein AVEN_175216-1 [Araneus ventricosus]|uniref:Uncharacterized protein n=1 Tax=Araneus ventricosus TaxID=182803 RepID=A0A4Y2SM33_ARAVE|nr:hypothetical protein AVEN_175216-1 [Araneus ventricosus]